MQNHREGEQALGPAVLYFGSRNPKEYMFRAELQCHLKTGVLSRLVVAFSGKGIDGDATDEHQSEVDELIKDSFEENEVIAVKRCNITDLVTSDTDGYLQNLMQQGAYVYVCGGAGHFGRAVRETVEQLVQTSLREELSAENNVDESSSSGVGTGNRNEGVRLLVNQKRYFEDLAD